MTDDEEDYFPHIAGFGSLQSLREGSEPEPRLAGLHSVKNPKGGVCRPIKSKPERVIGFHRPRT